MISLHRAKHVRFTEVNFKGSEANVAGLHWVVHEESPQWQPGLASAWVAEAMAPSTCSEVRS